MVFDKQELCLLILTSFLATSTHLLTSHTSQRHHPRYVAMCREIAGEFHKSLNGGISGFAAQNNKSRSDLLTRLDQGRSVIKTTVRTMRPVSESSPQTPTTPLPLRRTLGATWDRRNRPPSYVIKRECVHSNSHRSLYQVGRTLPDEKPGGYYRS